MEYLIVISIILIYSSLLTIILKKKIEETIPIAFVFMILIVYITGIFDNLKLGVMIIGIMAIMNIAIILYVLCKKKELKEIKKMLSRIFTPGFFIYICLCALFIFVNKGRICEDYDEFNHWARIVKNMFLYNSYGVNEESIVVFNEYPPFTAIFQYIFLTVKNIYREDVIITAQCILYLSIIIPITKNINWNKTLKNAIAIIPTIICVPIIFYENFYLDILVDGMLGVMFGCLVYTFYKEQDTTFKYIKIFSLLIMLTLTKTSGIALAILSIIIFVIKLFISKDKISLGREIKNIVLIIFLLTIITGIWYIKTNDAIKRWDFNQYIETENKTVEEQTEISKNFMKAIIFRNNITYKELTVLMIFFVLLCSNLYLLKKYKEREDKDYKYYSIAMFVSIPIYMIFLLITYLTIFDIEEASLLTCFDRYISTILLANTVFQLFAINNLEIKINISKILILFTIIIILLPYDNIYKKYINGKNYIKVSNINRDIYTKFRIYENKIDRNSKVLFIVGERSKLEYLKSLNEYEANILISETIVGDFKEKENFEELVKDYDYVFIYRMNSDSKEVVKSIFNNNYVNNDTLYKVKNESEIILERVKNN